jgi:hypothetical protein
LEIVQAQNALEHPIMLDIARGVPRRSSNQVTIFPSHRLPSSLMKVIILRFAFWFAMAFL